MTEETRYELNSAQVRGQTCRIYVDDRGRFSGVTPKGTETSGYANYESCVEGLKTLVAQEKVRVAIPFVTGSFKRAVATGIHAGTGNVLYNTDTKKGAQLETRSWHSGVFRDLTDAELAEGRRLMEAATEAKAAWNRWENDRTWRNFDKDVAKAVAGEGSTP